MGSGDLHGIFSRSSAVATGHTDYSLQQRVDAGTLQRLWRGRYVDQSVIEAQPSLPLQRLELYRCRVLAAAQAGRGRRVVSHHSAGSMHRVPLLNPDVETVAFTTDGTGRKAGRVVIHEAPIDPRDIVEVDGIRVTSLARTVADIARAGTFEQALTALDQGMRRGASMDDLERIAAEQSRRHGIAQLRSTLPLADRRSESVGESFSRALIIGFDDVPNPQLQVKVVAGGQAYWCDLGWKGPDGRLIAEFDGFVKYSRQCDLPVESADRVLFREKLREDAIRDSGIEVVRWGWEDLYDPDALRMKVIRGLKRAKII